jgi:hypothetical protein
MKASIRIEVRRMAAEIMDDLGIRPGETDLATAIDLCKRHGAGVYLFHSPALSEICPGFYMTGVVYGSRNLSHDELATVLIHELTHYLIRDSERFAHLNHERLSQFDRQDFHHALAMAVEALFVHKGGTDVRSTPLRRRLCRQQPICHRERVT